MPPFTTTPASREAAVVAKGADPAVSYGVRPRSPWREVAIPNEHGGWSLTGEPVLLGLLVAWSWPGLALGVAAMLAFVARSPLRVVLVDRYRERSLDRTRLAARIFAGELAVIAVLAAVATAFGDARLWLPLAAAAPLIAVELWFDMRSRSRRLIPELAGTVGIGSVVAAIALADGAGASLALGLWCVVSVRAAAAIPYVRTQILRLRRRPHQLWHGDLAQASAVAAVAVGWAVGAVPLSAAAAVALVSLLNVATLRTEPRPAKVLGMQQLFLGLAVVAVAAVAF